MRRTRQSTSSNAAGPPSDGADLPLLHPRILGQLSNSSDDRRAHSSEGDCLILSDDELERFDADRIGEVRQALSGEFAVSGWPLENGMPRRRPRWKKVVWAAVFLVLALAVGLTIGVVL